jgi:hypothetical protein
MGARPLSASAALLNVTGQRLEVQHLRTPHARGTIVLLHEAPMGSVSH